MSETISVPKPPAWQKRHEMPLFDRPDLERRRPVFFVPGWLTTYLHSAPLRQALQDQDLEVYNMGLPRQGTMSIPRNAAMLLARAVEMRILLDVDGFDWLCYGAGGLACRYMVEHLDGGRHVRRAILVGTPHHGTRLASLISFLPGAGGQMVPGSEFLQLLGAAERAHSLPAYINVYARHDPLLRPPASAVLQGAENLEVSWVHAHQRLLLSRRMMGLLSELLGRDIPAGGRRQADEARNRFEEMSEFIGDNPGEAGVFFSRAALLVEHGYWNMAIGDLDRAIKLRPDFTEAIYLRAQALRRRLKYDENPIHSRAIADLDLVIRAKPGHVEAYHQRGVAYALLGDWHSAADSWDRALIINRDYFPSYLCRALARMRRDEVAAAAEDLREVLRLQPDNDDAQHLLSRLP
ncbi:MAG: hypothetical protein ACYC55_01450 [Candidatus Geothermincolia bacterium]